MKGRYYVMIVAAALSCAACTSGNVESGQSPVKVKTWIVSTSENGTARTFSGTVEEFDNYIVPSTIFVTLASMPSAEELKVLPGVVDAENTGGMNYRVNFSDSREAITKIVETSVARNWQLLEIRAEKSSMDNVFAELSAKSKKH